MRIENDVLHDLMEGLIKELEKVGIDDVPYTLAALHQSFATQPFRYEELITYLANCDWYDVDVELPDSKGEDSVVAVATINFNYNKKSRKRKDPTLVTDCYYQITFLNDAPTSEFKESIGKYEKVNQFAMSKIFNIGTGYWEGNDWSHEKLKEEFLKLYPKNFEGYC